MSIVGLVANTSTAPTPTGTPGAPQPDGGMPPGPPASQRGRFRSLYLTSRDSRRPHPRRPFDQVTAVTSGR